MNDIPPTSSDTVFPFDAEFQRKILRLALDINLRRLAPDCFQSAFFIDGERGAFYPRQRLAQFIEEWQTLAGVNEVPGVASIHELITAACETQRVNKTQAALLLPEWQVVRDLVVTDPQFVLEKIRQWGQTAALRRTLAQMIDEYNARHHQGQILDDVGSQQIMQRINAALRVGRALSGAEEALERSDPQRWLFAPRKRIPTGLRPLDALLHGGPAVGESWYVLAPPKGAKTCHLLNFAMGAARQRKSVAYFTYEMTAEAVIRRMQQNMASATRGELQQDVAPLQTALSGWKAAGAGGISVHQFTPKKHGCAEAARVVSRLRSDGHPVDLVVLDYLNIMTSISGGKQELRHELASVARDMSHLAKDLDVVVWSATLSNRQAAKKACISATDIAEGYETVAVADGIVSVCGGEDVIAAGDRRLFVAVARDEADQCWAGRYSVDFTRMRITEAPESAAS